jgi:hypothetical protein
MATKNQHYVPKFYLRNFSYQQDEKQLGLFNLNNQFFIDQAPIKSQGSKKFFYGDDGIIENKLSKIEDNLARIIKYIINNKKLPKKATDEYFDLLAFIALTDLRNPVKIENTKEIFDEMKNRTLELYPNTDTKKILPSSTHQEIIELSLSHLEYLLPYIIDLDFKLLINKTKSPFISSDFPLIKYNQFLEWKKWKYSKTGFGTVGLQLFIPLNSEVSIIFFDPAIYKVGDKKQKSHIITNEQEIDSLNILQFLNCLETIYFDEKASENYIRSLYSKSKKFKRANITQSELNFLIKENETKDEIINPRKENLITVRTSDCEINLKVGGLKIHSKGLLHKLKPTLAQYRPLTLRLKNIEKN